MKKYRKRERNSFYYKKFGNNLFGKVLDKEFSSIFKLSG